MRKKRKSLVVALAATMALSAAAIASADGASENTSRVLGGFAPNKQSATTFGAGTLFTQVQTYDADSQAIPASAAERVYIDFDNDFKFDTRKVAKCSVSLANTSTEQAIAACPKAIVGSGQAVAFVPHPLGGANPDIEVSLTVTAFNGPTSTAGGACTTPAENVGGPEGCEFVGGKPTIRLHAYSVSPPFSTVVLGEIQDSSFGADYGKRLAVTDAPDTGLDAGALVLFNTTIGKQTRVRKVVRRNGRRVVTFQTYNYVSARCQTDTADLGTPKEWDFHAHWVYDDNTTDDDTYAQKCSN